MVYGFEGTGRYVYQVKNLIHLIKEVDWSIVCVFPSPGESLSRLEVSRAELELELNRLRAEEAKLRDDLLKMQALNEGLGHDKIQLNKIIMQVGKYGWLHGWICK